MSDIKSNFIHDAIDADLADGKVSKIHTRFPPEPNGYLHIGHCKALIIDFGTAERYGGLCNLRMDDTNPAKEDSEFVEAIKEDIHWLGFDWGERFFYGSDYFEATYQLALGLIKKGLAYVCELTPEQFKEFRGDINTPAKSPFRDRPVEQSLDLFARMRAGEFPEGSYTLRAKIDLASGNFNMRDPALYRIRYIEHHRQGNKWCIFPMYDFAHPIQDALEGITHSLCSLEYEAHRPLYDWVMNNTDVPHKSRQIEFARLNLTHTVMSKRYLRSLVESGVVDGWDDPRMPTLCGLRRRGYTPESVKDFVNRAGVAKVNSMVELELLEACLREELNETALRRVAVVDPIKVVLTNYPEGQTEAFTLSNHPNKPELGGRELSFSRELYIDASDFSENPDPKFFRMREGGEVRLMSAYIVRCVGAVKNPDGTVKEIHCTVDLDSRGGNPADGRKIKGTIHWLSKNDAVPTEFRLYDKLFTEPNMNDIPEDKTYGDYLNPNSVTVKRGFVEPSLKGDASKTCYQFVRTGYFIADGKDKGVWNRAATLKQ